MHSKQLTLPCVSPSGKQLNDHAHVLMIMVRRVCLASVRCFRHMLLSLRSTLDTNGIVSPSSARNSFSSDFVMTQFIGAMKAAQSAMPASLLNMIETMQQPEADILNVRKDPNCFCVLASVHHIFLIVFLLCSAFLKNRCVLMSCGLRVSDVSCYAARARV